MTYAETLLPEFDQEMANTRKVLERLPDDKLDWQAHPKSHTIGWNANHVADIPNWLVAVLTTPSLDIAPVGGEPYAPEADQPKGDPGAVRQERRGGPQGDRGDQGRGGGQPWTLLQGGHPIFTMPRSTMIRSYILNHIIHHRAILCVYLRLNDIPVPGMYGPSGDE